MNTNSSYATASRSFRAAAHSLPDPALDPVRLRVLLAALGIVLCCAALYWWSQRKIYPPASSAEALTLIKQFYTACNLQDPQLLERAMARLESAKSHGAVTEAEYASLAEIATGAQKSGAWDTAARSMLKYARDQRTD